MKPVGLRERKKAKTRALIQKEALRLFRAQGFAATTVEQVAEAAEVAPSTVFRYFPAKEDLVRIGHFPPFVVALVAAPPELGPIQAMRLAARHTFAARSAEELEAMMFTTPEIWAAGLGNVTGALAELGGILAERAGREPGDPEIRNVTAAITGVLLGVWFAWAKDPAMDGPAEVDRALAHLEAGLPLG